jgi:glycosyltransferase involved in cell wall biosynthesis
MISKMKSSKKNDILVLGSFGYEDHILNGQTVKTRQVFQLIKEKYKGEVDYFCSMVLRRKKSKYLSLIKKILDNNVIVVLYPAAGGFRTMLPMVYKIGRLFNKRIIYIAIGSAQVDCFEGTGAFNKPRIDLIKICRNLYAFLAETNKVATILSTRYKFNNVDVFPNFRAFDSKIAFSPASKQTLRLVFFARITPKKGYDVAFEFIRSIKDKNLDITLDFYGPLDGDHNKEFLELIDKYKDFGVSYKGILQPENIHETLQKYDVLVHPTLIDGIPGSIIDAYISSLTVVATRWEYADEIIDDGYNGFIVPYDNPKKQLEFNDRILRLYNDRDLLNKMKQNAYDSRLKYSSEAAWNVLRKYL